MSRFGKDFVVLAFILGLVVFLAVACKAGGLAEALHALLD